MKNNQKEKSIKIWVLLLTLPIVSLVLVAMAQIAVRFFTASTTDITEMDLEAEASTSVLEMTVNIFSFVVGTASVIALLLTPLWIVMIVKTLNERNKE